MKRSVPLRRTRLVRRPRLLCGSLREHRGHVWAGQSDGVQYRCPGVKDRKARPRSGMVPARPDSAVPPSVRKALRERSGGWCEARLDGCWGRATDPAHRIASGNGGRHGEAKVHHDRLSNLVHACRACHEWCHRNVGAAERLGLMLRDGDAPEEKQVLLPAHGWVLLDNDGGWRFLREAA